MVLPPNTVFCEEEASDAVLLLNQSEVKQVVVAGFICLLNLTLNEKLASYTLQFVLKYHVFLN